MRREALRAPKPLFRALTKDMRVFGMLLISKSLFDCQKMLLLTTLIIATAKLGIDLFCQIHHIPLIIPTPKMRMSCRYIQSFQSINHREPESECRSKSIAPSVSSTATGVHLDILATSMRHLHTSLRTSLTQSSLSPHFTQEYPTLRSILIFFGEPSISL